MRYWLLFKQIDSKGTTKALYCWTGGFPILLECEGGYSRDYYWGGIPAQDPSQQVLDSLHMIAFSESVKKFSMDNAQGRLNFEVVARGTYDITPPKTRNNEQSINVSEQNRERAVSDETLSSDGIRKSQSDRPKRRNSVRRDKS